MNDEYGADNDLLEAMAATDTTTTTPVARPPVVQQPKPQRLDRAPPPHPSDKAVVQPKPQAAPKKSSGSAILVSPRQRGNPLLTSLRSLPWEYSDIPADYLLGQTTCALFLSLKYHRLHPEYIYKRIQNLQGRYSLRIVLTLVDIPNHEDPLRELSKTSLVNKVTIILCWSAAEAARYLELYKSYENAQFTAIRGQQSSNYADRLVDFVTVPRSLNKSDAVALVANFGSLKNAINADPEQLGLLGGWGEVKVKRWMAAKEEPFRAKKATKRGQQKQTSTTSTTDAQDDAAAAVPDSEGSFRVGQSQLLSPVPLARVGETASQGSSLTHQQETSSSSSSSSSSRAKRSLDSLTVDQDEEAEILAASLEEPRRVSQPVIVTSRNDGNQTTEEGDGLSEGVAAALAKLREKG